MAANAALAKIQKRTKALKREHPNMKHATAQKQAGAEYRAGKLGAVRKVSGVKKRPAASQKKAVRASTHKTAVRSPKRKTIIRTQRVTSIGKIKAPKTDSSAVTRAATIVKKIDKFEAKLKKEKNSTLKDIIKRAINAEYDKLDAIKKALKKSA